MTSLSHEPALPLRRRIWTSDADVALAELRALYGGRQLDIDGPFEWRTEVDDLGPISLVRDICDPAVRIDATPEDHLLNLPRTGVARGQSPLGSVDATSGRSAMLFNPGTRLVWHSPGDVRSLSVRINAEFLAAQLEALTGAPAQRPINFALDLPTFVGTGAYVERLCRFIGDELDRGTLANHPVVMTGLLESFAHALLTGHSHDHGHLFERPAPPSSRTVVRLVEEYVDAHAGEPLKTADLAAVAGAPMRSVEAAFRKHRNTTPAVFIRGRRLSRAHQMLLADPHASMHAVAHAAGFARWESFSAAYVAAFGERPEDTRRQSLIAAGERQPVAAPRISGAAQLALLSPREREVCVGVSRGMLNKQIAAALGITERTVKAHRALAMRKLGASSAVELTRLFERADP